MRLGEVAFLTLAVLAGVAMIFGATAFAQQGAQYIGSTKCKICHNTKEQGEIWNVWKNGPHAKAIETLKTDHAKEAAKKANVSKPPEEAPECLACHLTAFDPKAGAAPAAIAKDEGVGCESCHGPASLHQPAGMKYKKDPSVNILATIKMGDEATCVVCHNEKSPTWNPNRYTTADGKKVGFDFKQAWEKIKHTNPSRKAK